MNAVFELAGRLRGGTIGLVIVVTMVLLALFAPAVAPHDPYAQQISQRLIPPFFEPGGTTAYPLGTDQLGRDVASRLIYASRWSILVGVFAVLVAGAIGIPLGLVAGFYGGYVDAAVTFLVNTAVAFPFLVLALGIIAFLGPGFANLVLVLGVAGWTGLARVVRTEVLSLRGRDFILASRTLGATDLWLIRRHVLPMVTSSILVLVSLQVAGMILSEAFLSFVGFGIQPPTPSWGSMLADARVYMLSNWWLATFPGVAIFLTALGVNLLGDGLRDLSDPRMRRTGPTQARAVIPPGATESGEYGQDDCADVRQCSRPSQSRSTGGLPCRQKEPTGPVTVEGRRHHIHQCSGPPHRRTDGTDCSGSR